MTKRTAGPLTPEQRSLRAKAAVDASWAHTSDRAARTEPARRAALARFERQVDPDRELPDDERQRRAESARRSYFPVLALRSARKRGGGHRTQANTAAGRDA